MRILVAIVHHWNPKGGGRHASLRPDHHPRKHGLQHQLMSLRRLGHLQGTIDFSSLAVKPMNESLGNVIDIRLITDGKHTVIDYLDKHYSELFNEITTDPLDGLHLGFEAQKYLASQLNKKYDLYCYMEDDLIIHDPVFFQKIAWFNKEIGDLKVLLPHRFEFSNAPGRIEKLFIDGPAPPKDVRSLIPKPSQALVAGSPAGNILYESPANPHAGCFFLTHKQLEYWSEHPSWQDGDISYVSPLESAATLGLTKAFSLYKPSFTNASWLEVQHWGTSFICWVHPKKTAASGNECEKAEDEQVYGYKS